MKEAKTGHSASPKTGGRHVPGGQKWGSAGASVTESRLNKGGDQNWKGKKSK